MPFWRLSLFYWFFFASLGALMPYWSLYLDELGFSAAEIGQLMAILMATKLIAPNVWGWIADHTGKRTAIIRWGTFLAAASFALVFWGQSYWWLAGVMVAFSFFWNAALPQFEATTMTRLGDDVHRYSHIRMWGSVGFIVAVAAMGPALDRFGVGLVPSVVMVLMAGLFVSSLVAPDDEPAPGQHAQAPLWQTLKQPRVIALFAVCFLMQASHGPYYTFYSIYLADYGYSRTLIGQLWALGVVAEVLVFVVLHRWIALWGLRMLFLISFALTTVRWIAIGTFPESMAVLIMAQTLHAVSFGVYHVVAIQLVHRYFTGRSQGRGQALYSSLGFGAGGAIGSVTSGMLWDSAGAGTTFILASALSFAGLLIVWRAIRE